MSGVLFAFLIGCPATDFDVAELEPYPNPYTSEDPQWSAQPHRDQPTEIVVDAAGETAWISLTGTPDEPGDEIVVVDLVDASVRSRVTVGRSPIGLALHPDGEVLVVLNRFSNFLSLLWPKIRNPG